MTKKLIFPENVLDQHLVVLGKTGAGKSSALRHIVEHLLSKKKRVCVIDPKGDWSGLKVGADGESPGFPIILFGDFKEIAGQSIPPDVPLNEYSGKHVAELVTSGNRPCVVGLRGWTQGEMHRFWIDFASTFFNTNEGEFYLVVDEVHNFAPKGKVLSPEVGKCLHWTNRLLSEARGLGAVMLIASQRPQKVHNDTLTACETLVAMRVIHKADRDAIEDWIKGNGDKDISAEVLNSLAGMKRGEAYVWSPEVEFGPERLTFPMFTTYDSFAPPQLQKKISGKDWASVDLEAVKEKLAAVIEKAKAEDPRELQKTIGELRQQLRKAESAKPQATKESVEVAVKQAVTKATVKLSSALEEAMRFIVKINAQDFKGEGIDENAVKAAVGAAMGEIKKSISSKLSARDAEIEKLSKEGSALLRKLTALTGDNNVEIDVTVQHNKPFTVSPASRPTRPARSAIDSNGDISGPMQKILNELAELEAVGISPADKAQLGLFCGYTNVKSGGFTGPLGKLRELELIHYPGSGEVALTDRGRNTAAEPGTPLTTTDLQDRIVNKLDGPRAKVLRELIAIYPDAISKATLGENLGYTNVKSGGFTGPLGSLRKLGLIEYPQSGTVAASELLFPAGLE